MNYQNYIKTELLVLVPVLYFVGMGLKKSKLPDKWIPVTLGVVSIFLAALWLFATTKIEGVRELVLALFSSITQGVLAAGASVYTNQIFLQSKKEE